jgi:predicted O-methyltransferase YrrM
MKLSTVKWFLTHPQFLPQAFHILKRRVLDRADRFQEAEAIQWCKENEQSVKAIFNKLGIEVYELDIRNKFKEYFEYADQQSEQTPVQMGGPGGLTTLFNLANHFKPLRLLETGVAYGWSSLAILLAVKDQRDASLISVDMPYVSMNNESFVGTVVRGDLKDKWTLIRKADRQGIPQALTAHSQTLDFIHYDSDKSHSGRSWAYPILWQALKSRGVFISDDIQDNTAFKEFCESIKKTPLIHESDGKYVGILFKD